MNKRGQFYLVAAIIISTLVIGLTTVLNYYKENKTPNLEETGEQLKIESRYVLDYAAINGVSASVVLKNFVDDFSYSLPEETQMYVVIGDKGAINAYKYYNNGTYSTISYVENANDVSIDIEGQLHTFNLYSGTHFYFVLYKNINNETFITTNK